MNTFNLSTRWTPRQGAVNIAPVVVTWRVTSFILPGAIRLVMKKARYPWALWEAHPIETAPGDVPAGYRTFVGQPFPLALAGQGAIPMLKSEIGEWYLGFRKLGRRPVTAEYCGFGPNQWGALQGAIEQIETLAGKEQDEINRLFWIGWNARMAQLVAGGVESY